VSALTQAGQLRAVLAAPTLRSHSRRQEVGVGRLLAPSAGLLAQPRAERSVRGDLQNPRVAPYSWTVREGSLDGPVVMREYVYDVPDKEPVEGQELYLSNGSGPWRVSLLEKVPEVYRSPYNILVVERVDY
jgi:hypothetical protein